MVKRRTRSSSRADATLHACRFQGCTVSFATAAEQKKHETIHQADKPLKCDESGCNERFATSADRQEHTRTSHARRRSKRQRSENRSDALALDEVQPQMNEYPEEKNGSEFVDRNVVQEADEIVENAVYLASQMKIARVGLTPAFVHFSCILHQCELAHSASLLTHLLLKCFFSKELRNRWVGRRRLPKCSSMGSVGAECRQGI